MQNPMELDGEKLKRRRETFSPLMSTLLQRAAKLSQAEKVEALRAPYEMLMSAAIFCTELDDIEGYVTLRYDCAAAIKLAVKE